MMAVAIFAFYCSPVMAQQVAEQTQLDRDGIFAAMDLDQDKSLSPDEYAAGTVGKMRKSKDEEFASKDKNGDKLLSFEEYKKNAKGKGGQPKGPAPTKESRDKEFKGLDTDKNNSISLSEFVGERVGSFKDDREKVFYRKDVNADKSLSFDEYAELGPVNKDQAKLGELRLLDKDRNGSVSMKEFVGDLQGDEKKSREKLFYMRDKNNDQSISANEFLVVPSGKASPEQLKSRDFRYYDLDHNSQISLDEFTKTRKETEKPESVRRAFYLNDSDDSNNLSEKEFLDVGAKAKKITSRSDFRLRDTDQDDFLSLTEYLAHPSRDDTPATYRKFDLNGDHKLNFEEFSYTPGRKPASDVVFDALDRNKDGKLTADETAVPKQQKAATKEVKDDAFSKMDADRDGSVSKNEYLASENDRLASTAPNQSAPTNTNVSGNASVAPIAANAASANDKKKQEFAKLDIDKNEGLTKDEFLNWRPWNLKSESEKRFFQKDKNTDKSISIEEFVSEERVNAALVEFRMSDIDGDDFLSMAEFLGDRQGDVRTLLESKFVERDLNGDEKISSEEFELTKGKKLPTEEEKLEKKKEEFAKIDLDKNSVISLKEYFQGYLMDEKPMLARRFFLNDADENSALSLAEFADIGTPGKKLSNRGAFRFRDSDQDDLLTATEYGSYSADDPSEIFAKFDSDGNKKLSFEEFTLTPDCQPIDESAVAESDLNQKRTEDFAKLDKDGNKQLSIEEFLSYRSWNLMLDRKRRFFQRDRSGDGSVSLDEFLDTVKLNRKDSLLADFRMMDADGNASLSKVEFLGNRDGDSKKLLEGLFAERDADGNEKISSDEYIRKLATEDDKKEFGNIDLDQNSKISVEEYQQANPIEEKQALAKRFFQSDIDDSNALSLEEFIEIAAPDKKFSNLGEFRYLDADQDGFLTEGEYAAYSFTNPKAFFVKFDFDKDKKLSFQEFDLTPGRKRDPEVVFDSLDRDKDGKLTRAEFSGTEPAKKPIEKQIVAKAGFFGSFDRDKDEALSKAEYVNRDKLIQSQKFWKWAYKAAMDWAVYLFVAADILLVGLVVWKLSTKKKVVPASENDQVPSQVEAGV